MGDEDFGPLEQWERELLRQTDELKNLPQVIATPRMNGKTVPAFHTNANTNIFQTNQRSWAQAQAVALAEHTLNMCDPLKPGKLRIEREDEALREAATMWAAKHERFTPGFRYRIEDNLGLGNHYVLVWTNFRYKELSMLDTLLKLYHAYMLQDVRSPMPHLAGPAGVGKSTVVAELGRMVGRRVHIINVSRISPLELEGVQMPVSQTEGIEHELKLRLLHSPVWTNLEEGDIVLFDEFLRGFPEVYNGLLDIMTSREVAGFALPKVFMIGASNSISTYDGALQDRLLNVFVPDIRTSQSAKGAVMQQIVDRLGLNPACLQTTEMADLIRKEIEPMYEVLDQMQGKAGIGTSKTNGHSARNLIGQAQLREVQSEKLKALIQWNNTESIRTGKEQYVLLLSGNRPDPKYVKAIDALKALSANKLTEVQRTNLELNIALIDMETAISAKKTTIAPDLNEDPLLDLNL